MHDQTEAALQTDDLTLVDVASDDEEEPEEPDNDLFSLVSSEEDREDSDLIDDEALSTEFQDLQEESSEAQTRRTDVYRRHYQSDATERSERMRRRSRANNDDEVRAGGGCDVVLRVGGRLAGVGGRRGGV